MSNKKDTSVVGTPSSPKEEMSTIVEGQTYARAEDTDDLYFDVFYSWIDLNDDGPISLDYEYLRFRVASIDQAVAKGLAILQKKYNESRRYYADTAMVPIPKIMFVRSLSTGYIAQVHYEYDFAAKYAQGRKS